MIIGRGDLASVLTGVNNDWLWFASGVSNSNCEDEAEYTRERELLLSHSTAHHVVYFSSLAALYANSRYLQHKRDMEAMVKANFPFHTIVRIGNIDWGENPHTLINYLKAHPEAEIKDEYRYIVSKEELLYWLKLLPRRSCEISIMGRRMKVQEVKDEYCHP